MTAGPPGASDDDPGASEIARQGRAPLDGVVRSPILRAALATFGWLSVALGAIGVVVPGWPTTPWLLLAAYLFARSSPRFHRWLISHRLFGPTVRDIRAGRGLPARTKAFAITMTALFAGTSALLLAPTPLLGGTVAVAALIGIAAILRLPTRRPSETHRADGERSSTERSVTGPEGTTRSVPASVEDDEL